MFLLLLDITITVFVAVNFTFQRCPIGWIFNFFLGRKSNNKKIAYSHWAVTVEKKSSLEFLIL